MDWDATRFKSYDANRTLLTNGKLCLQERIFGGYIDIHVYLTKYTKTTLTLCR